MPLIACACLLLLELGIFVKYQFNEVVKSQDGGLGVQVFYVPGLTMLRFTPIGVYRKGVGLCTFWNGFHLARVCARKRLHVLVFWCDLCLARV